MTKPLKIDFVSDVSCPWCIVGLGGLEEALRRVGDLVEADIRFQPFELNPAMPAGGQNIVEHIGEKYGSTPAQSAANREMIHARAASVGFTMKTDEHSRIYNTFDAHRLLAWAEDEGRQRQLKVALLEAYFTRCEDPSNHQVLLRAVEHVGLDRETAAHILGSNEYADDVRTREQFFLKAGVKSVPAVIINQRHLISGGQLPEVFERALREIPGLEAQDAPAA